MARGAKRVRRERACMALFVALSLVGAASVGPALAESADSTPDRAERISELEGLLGELGEDEAAALRELETVRSARAELDARVAALAAEIETARANLAEANARVDDLTVQYLGYEEERVRTQADLREARESFESAAVALYQTGGSAGRAFTMLVVDATDPLTIGVGTRYLSGVLGERQDVVKGLGDLEDSYELLLDVTEKSRVQAAEARADAEAEAGRLDELLAEQERARGDALAQEAREEQLVAEIRSQQDDYEAELAALRATSNAITEMLLSAQGDQTRASDFTASRPVPGQVTSGFGLRVHPILGNTRMHNGLDMAGSHGSKASAAAPGAVIWAGPRSGYGNTVIVDHGNQYATLYAHLSQIWVGEGESVSTGDGVGAVGMTGLATGPHLHFEVRLLGVPVNPADYL